MTTRRWYYLVPAKGAPRGLVHAIESHNLDDLPGEKRVYAGREQLAAGLAGPARRASAGWRWSTRRATPSPTCHASTRARSRAVRQLRRRGGVLRRSGAAIRGGLDETMRCATHLAAVRAALSHQGSRVRSRFARTHGGRRSASPSSKCRSAMVEWFADGGPDQPTRRRTSRRRRTRATRTTGHSASAPGHSPTAKCVLIDLWGKLPEAGRGVCRHHVGRLHRDRTVPDRIRDGVRGRARRPRCGGRTWCSTAVRDGARAARLRSGPRVPGGDRTRGIRRAVHPSHRDTASARTCTATASTWTTTKRTTTGGCCPAPASRLNPVSTRTDSASGPKSTCSSASGRPRLQVPCKQEIVTLI